MPHYRYLYPFTNIYVGVTRIPASRVVASTPLEGDSFFYALEMDVPGLDVMGYHDVTVETPLGTIVMDQVCVR